MRESVSSVTLFNLVIVFVLLFTGYISLSLNYSKAYNVKNELVNIIKNQGGVCTSGNIICSNFSDQIEDYFGEISYHSHGSCGSGWYGFKRNGDYIGENATDAAFCVKAIKVNNNSELPNDLYYQVKLFYQLDLPIFNRLFNFRILGETSRIYEPNECLYEAAHYNWC